jgi:hypothetical protein
MDLFIDRSYELHCENKLNYFSALYSPTGSLPSGYTLRNASGQTIVRTANAVVVYQASGIDSVRITRDSTGAYMEEFKISSTAKKFVLE